jgi:integral membrane protein (TIGR01906 family)
MNLARLLGQLAVATAAAVVITALTIAPFLSPAWVAFEQDRAAAALWTGFAPGDLRSVTDAILHDLVIGPPAFDVALDGAPVLKPSERAHMQDVRGVFAGFYLVACGGGVLLAGAALLTRRSPGNRAVIWRAIRHGTRWLAATLVVVGALMAVAFDAVFEVFHRLFFKVGTYDFDPRTDRLVQLFPDQFWSETAMVVGAVIVIVAVAVAAVAGRRARRLGEVGAA